MEQALNIDFKKKVLQEFDTFLNNQSRYEPVQLQKIRQKAIEYFSQIGLPSNKNEEWRFTNLQFLSKQPYTFSCNLPDDTDLEIEDIIKYHYDGKDINLMVFVNGYFVPRFSTIVSHAPGIRISSISAAFRKYYQVIINHLGNYPLYENDAFTAMNTAFSQDGAFIKINDGIQLNEAIHLLYINDARKEAIATFPRNLILLGECSQAQITESVYTIGNNSGFTNMVTEIHNDRFSRLDYYKLQNDAGNTYYIGTTQAIQERGSILFNDTVTLEGKFVRNNINTIHNDELCETNFYGLYFIDGDSFVDNHTLIDHSKPNCQSNEVYKGILDDNSKAVFNGKIIVRKNAQHTNAYQQNRNVLLTDDATINTKPQLEIFADDVKCSHGATSGYLDKDSMFYLKARGIPEDKARALLLNAFASDIIDKINNQELRDFIKNKINDRLKVSEIYFCELISK